MSSLQRLVRDQYWDPVAADHPAADTRDDATSYAIEYVPSSTASSTCCRCCCWGRRCGCVCRSRSSGGGGGCDSCGTESSRRCDRVCATVCVGLLVVFLFLASIHFWLPFACPAIAGVAPGDNQTSSPSPASSTSSSRHQLCQPSSLLAYSAIVQCLQFCVVLASDRALVSYITGKLTVGYLNLYLECANMVRGPFYLFAATSSIVATLTAISLALGASSFEPSSSFISWLASLLSVSTSSSHAGHANAVVITSAYGLQTVVCGIAGCLAVWRAFLGRSAAEHQCRPPDADNEDESSSQLTVAAASATDFAAAADSGRGGTHKLLFRQALLIAHLTERNRRLGGRLRRLEEENAAQTDEAARTLGYRRRYNNWH